MPRLHFSGHFRADVNTRNNENCNFDLSNRLYPPEEWNFAGTEEFEFIDAKITSVIDKNGNEDSTSELLGAEIFSNDNEPFAKIVDLDVDFQVSSIFGLKFGLKHNGTDLFVGNWTPCVIVNDMWIKVKCACMVGLNSTLFSTQSTTKIADIIWSNSNLISEFKSEIQKSSNELQVSITLDSYSCNVFTIGHVYGTIGKTTSSEPLCVGGERKMEPVDPQPLLIFDKNNPCSKYVSEHKQQEQMPWMYSAPFKYDSKRKVFIVDLSNALPMHFTCIGYQKVTAPINLGDLYFGYIEESNLCSYNRNLRLVKPIGNSSIPYLKGDIWKKSGIIEVPFQDNDVKLCHYCSTPQIKLVIFKYTNNTVNCDYITKHNHYVMNHHCYLCSAQCRQVSLLLNETKFFVRPMGYYMARLENISQPMHPNKSFIINNHNFTLLVTHSGRPASDKPVTLIKSYN